MKKYDLLRSGDNIVRVLGMQDDGVLVIDCIKRTMPVWVDSAELEAYSECTSSELSKATGVITTDVDALDATRRKVMYERYTMIAPILSCIADDKARSKMICSIATEHGVSKQTIRNYLCLYLVYLDIAVLAPKVREHKRQLTQDEKNIRWALNKFFYTTKKHSLMTAYTMMLKEKYCDPLGKLVEKYPSFYQFRYFYRKTRNLQNYYISRDGLKSYQRNNRPLVGEGVQEFAPAVGVGMLDATVCDIYLVNDTGSLVGRPILTTCVDAYSGLCCGYSLSWEGGVYSLRGLMLNIIADKVDWCNRFGISIQREDWDCDMLPASFITDMGSEYTSETFEQIAELGVKVVNLPSYRPELKGLIEKFFDLIQESFKKHLKGKGVIEPDYQERGAHDYRKDACLTMTDFEKIVLHCIIYYNSQRIIENFPYTKDMIVAQVKPYASQIWNWGKSQIGANLIGIGKRELMLTLLPRTTGRFSRSGLKVNKLRYHCEGYTEQYLSGGDVTVAYNPEDVTSVWVLEDGTYTEFTIIESRYQGKDLTAVQELQTIQKDIARSAVRDNLQAQINLVQHIEATFDYVQEEMARRRELGCFANKALNLSCLSTKIKCGNCGRSFVRSARKQGGYVIWTCGSKKGRTESCGARDIPEKLLKSVCADVLGTDEFDENYFAERIENIVVIGKDTMEFHFYGGEVKAVTWKSDAKKAMWTPERKALWSEYNYLGGRNGTGMGFNEWKEVAVNGKKSNGDSGHHQ